MGETFTEPGGWATDVFSSGVIGESLREMTGGSGGRDEYPARIDTSELSSRI